MHRKIFKLGSRVFKAIYFLMAFFIFSNPLGFCANPGSPHELSLKESILIAYKSNKEIQIEAYGIAIAKAQIMGAKSGFLPTINLDASYTRNHKVINPPSVLTGYKNNNILGFSLAEALYDGGSTISKFNQAKLGLKVSEETLRAKKLDIEFQTKRLYYGLLLAYEVERIARELVENAQAHYEETQSLFNQGIVSRFDVLQSKVQVSLLVPELVKAGNAIEVINAEFMQLLSLKIRDTLKPKEKLLCNFIEAQEDEFLKTAYLGKPEMILKSLNIDIKKWGIELSKSGWRPQLDVNAGYNYTAGNLNDMFNAKQNNWNAGVAVTLPLFDGFSTKAKVDAAKQEYSQSIISKEQVVDQVAVDIRKGCLNLAQSRAIIESQRDNLGEAKEALRLSEVRLRNGVGINLDVLDSQVALGKVEKNLAEGTYDYLMAQAFLDLTMGRSYIKEALDGKDKI